jgi:putative hemolysin
LVIAPWIDAPIVLALEPVLGDLKFDLAALALLIVMSAIFSGSETAITSLDNLKLRSLMKEEGDPQGPAGA